MEIFVEGTPVAQPRPKVSTIHGRARAYVPAKHKVHRWRDKVRDAVALRWCVPTDEPLTLVLRFAMPRTQAQTWKRRPMVSLPHTKKPDVDNLAKSVMDAMEGLVFESDAQVVSLRVEKYVAAGDESPGVWIKCHAAREVE